MVMVTDGCHKVLVAFSYVYKDVTKVLVAFSYVYKGVTKVLVQLRNIFTW